VVVNYKLSGYAKNALKKYVPQLTTTYNAGELHDAHPVRFTNEGLRLDHKPENAIESGTSKSRTTRTTTSGCQHNRIPNNGTGWKR